MHTKLCEWPVLLLIALRDMAALHVFVCWGHVIHIYILGVGNGDSYSTVEQRAAENAWDRRRPREGKAEGQGKARPRKPTAGTGPRARPKGGREKDQKRPKGPREGGKTASGPQGPKGRKGTGREERPILLPIL